MPLEGRPTNVYSFSAKKGIIILIPEYEEEQLKRPCLMSLVAIERAVEYRAMGEEGIGTRTPFTETYGPGPNTQET